MEASTLQWMTFWMGVVVVLLLLVERSVARANRELQARLSRDAEARSHAPGRAGRIGGRMGANGGCLDAQVEPVVPSVQREAFIDLGSETNEAHVTVRLPWRTVRKLGLTAGLQSRAGTPGQRQ